MAADQLKLPFIYVRPKPKEHGLKNQIEGFYESQQKVLVVEDLISTGKSSLQCVDVLRKENLNVIGMVSIFNYGFDVAEQLFLQANVPYKSLTNYKTLIELSLEKNIVTKETEHVLLNWRSDPANWKGT
jgi:orotate phosphoribosyltransferase